MNSNNNSPPKKITPTGYHDSDGFHSTLCHPSGKIKTHNGMIIDLTTMTDEKRKAGNEAWFNHMVQAAGKYCKDEKND